jgi:hypothetical protein
MLWRACVTVNRAGTLWWVSILKGRCRLARSRACQPADLGLGSVLFEFCINNESIWLPRRARSRSPDGDQPFSSFFSSLKNRQSVPWAMILLGPLLMSPASCKRSDQKRTVSVGSISRHRL